MMGNERLHELDYSVLMSVYEKETASHLRAAMESVWNQTLQTDDFVLVCDGPLTEELETVIADMRERYPEALRVIRLARRQGLGNALNAGIRECRHELVARMDSDDISCPDRCQRQVKIFAEHPEFSLVSGSVMEFDDNSSVKVMRQLPERQEEILKFAKMRNPFNHPCVMYKKSAVEGAGGYRDFFLLEDYYLWIRMLKNGAVGYNIPECLLLMRSGEGLYRRRSGIPYVKSQWKLLGYMRREGIISPLEYVLYGSMRTIASLIPNRARQRVFLRFARKPLK